MLTLDKLLVQVNCAGKGLAVWLREQFFEQHSKRFHHRPFIWHVWDGQRDGFGALVNYHKLDAKNLERLIHTYLGDWIRTQEAGVTSGIDGAPLRLSAAQNLKIRLQAILDGEKPYDIFVRWKPLDEQSIGWNPDLNDGVRPNIRPFMTAEVLRHNKKPKLNITWDKDRGKDVESAPWFNVFQGKRINDHHLMLSEKSGVKLGLKTAHLALSDLVEVGLTVSVDFGNSEAEARQTIFNMASTAAGCLPEDIEVIGVAQKQSIFATLRMKLLHAVQLQIAVTLDLDNLPEQFKKSKVDCSFGLKEIQSAFSVADDAPLVVFVHGLGGTSDTFGDFPAFLHANSAVECMNFLYPSAPAHAADLYFVAKQLGNEVLLRNRSNIIFVAHSLGGLVVRKLLAEVCSLRLIGEPISKYTRVVSLFASPTSGSAIASCAKYVPYGLNHPHLSALQKSSGQLVQLNEAWKNWCQGHPECDVLNFYGTSDSAVTEADASSGPGEGFPVAAATHSSIVKPSNGNDFVVLQLASRIKKKLLH